VTAIRVLVADDEQVVRAGFAALLGTQPDFDVVGTARDGIDAIELATSHLPDIVLMDVRMPNLDGINATKRITQDNPNVRVIVLTTFDLDDYVFNALRAGATGFLLKDVSAETLFAAVRTVSTGDALLTPTVTRRLIEEFVRSNPNPTRSQSSVLATLTNRETEVLTLLARGLSNSEIAEMLCLSDETIKTHVSRTLNKLGCRDRTQAVIAAYDHHLVTPRAN
jgi:DNA-binding NarL/FixJ family response regulator